MTAEERRRYSSRKFVLCAAAQLTVTIGLFMGLFNAGEYTTATSLILGLYGTADVTQDYLQRGAGGG